MKIEFPQRIVEIEKTVVVSLMYADGRTGISELHETDELLNDKVMKGEPVTLILGSDLFYCGAYEGVVDSLGEIVVKLRSIVCRSCFVNIPISQIKGWCFIPDDHER